MVQKTAQRDGKSKYSASVGRLDPGEDIVLTLTLVAEGSIDPAKSAYVHRFPQAFVSPSAAVHNVADEQDEFHVPDEGLAARIRFVSSSSAIRQVSVPGVVVTRDDASDKEVCMHMCALQHSPCLPSSHLRICSSSSLSCMMICHVGCASHDVVCAECGWI